MFLLNVNPLKSNSELVCNTGSKEPLTILAAAVYDATDNALIYVAKT